MARLTQDPFILIQEDRDMEISRIFQEEGLRPNIQYTLSDDFAILAMVEQGLGVSILSEMLVRSTNRHVTAIPLERPRYREIGLAVRRGAPIPPLTRCFRDFVLQWLGSRRLDPRYSGPETRAAVQRQAPGRPL